MPTSLSTPRTFKERFAARFDYRYKGLVVLATETSPDVWTVSEYPGVGTIVADINNEYSYDQVFYSGETYTVLNGLATALVAAGYTVAGPGFDSGFSEGFDIA
jgi:hypothetical protein